MVEPVAEPGADAVDQHVVRRAAAGGVAARSSAPGCSARLALRDFALALFVGLITGAYSSIFVATPILAWLKEREPRYRALRDRAEADLAAVGARAGGADGRGGRQRAATTSAPRRPSSSTTIPADAADVDDGDATAPSCCRRADGGRHAAPRPRRGRRHRADRRPTATAVQRRPAAPAAPARSADRRRFARGAVRGRRERVGTWAAPMSTTEPRVEIRTDRRSVLPWRRQPPSTSRSRRWSTAYHERHRKADTDADRAGLRAGPAWPTPSQVRRSGEPYIAHPLGVAHDPRRPRPRRRHHRRRAAARRGRGHRASPSTTSSASSAPTSPRIVDGVTKLDRLAVRLQGGAAGRDDAQDARRDGQGHPRPAHQARRPPPQHAHDRVAAGGEAAAHRAGDARHLRAARAPPRHRRT